MVVGGDQFITKAHALMLPTEQGQGRSLIDDQVGD